MSDWAFNCNGSLGVCHQHDERTAYPSHPCWGWLQRHNYHFYERLYVTSVQGNLISGENGTGPKVIRAYLSEDGIGWALIGTMTTGDSASSWPFSFVLAIPMWAKHLRFECTDTLGYVDGSNGTVTYTASSPSITTPDAIIDFIQYERLCQNMTTQVTGYTNSDLTCPSLVYIWTLNGVVIGSSLPYVTINGSSCLIGDNDVGFQTSRGGLYSPVAHVNLVVGKHPPVAVVDTWPGTGSYVKGIGLEFKGHADSGLRIPLYEWVSDIDGVFSTTDEFVIGSLSVGTHNITFTVWDEVSHSGTVIVGQLTIVAPTDPVIMPKGKYGRAFDTVPSYVRIGTRMNGRTRRGGAGGV